MESIKIIPKDGNVPKNCDVCRKSVVSPDGFEIQGLKIEVNTSGILGGNEAYRSFIEQHMEPFKVDRVYRVCFPCLLRAVGVKP